MVERVRFELSATDKTKRAFSAVRRGLDRMKRIVLSLKAAFGALVVAAALRGLVRGIQGAVDKLDLIAKTADKIGITTTALQELQVAADLAGVGANVLDKALLKFTRSISESRAGVLEYKEVFDKLGISMRNERTGEFKTLEELLGEVANAFAGMKDSVEITAAALDLFGARGAQMVTLLRPGADALDRMRQKAQDLGLVFDEDLLRSTEDIKDEMTLLTRVMDKVVTEALVKMAPALLVLMQHLADATVFVSNFTAKFIENSKVLLQHLGILARPINIQIANLTPELEKVIKVFDAIDLKINEALDNGISFDTMFDRYNASLLIAKKRVGEVTLEMTALIRTRDELKNLPSLADLFVPGGASAGSGAGSGGTTTSLVTAADPFKKFRPTITNLTLGDAQQAESARIRNLVVEFQTLEEVMTIGIVGAANSIGDAFARMAMGVKVTFRDLVSVILSDIIRMQFQAASSHLGGLLTAAIGAAFAPGAFNSASSSNFGTSVTGNSPFASKAHGGSVFAGQPVKVHANELFIPPVNGRILTAAQSERFGRSGGGAVVVQIINNTPVPTRQEQATGPNGESISRFIIEEVSKAKARGEFDAQDRQRFGRGPMLITR